MSAPNTNLNKQAKRHKGPLLGMIAAVVLAVVLLVWFLSHTFSDTATTTSDPAQEQIQDGVLPAEGTSSMPLDPGSDSPQTIEPTPPPAD